MDKNEHKPPENINLRIKPHQLKPILISIFLIAVYRLGVLIQIPFLNEAGINAQTEGTVFYTKSDGAFSIFMLGIMPYASTYLIIEILSLIVPFMKRIRSRGLDGRRQLKRIALSLSIVLAVVQANGIIKGLEGLTLSDGSSALNVSTAFEHVLLVCILVGSFYVLVSLCELISRFGICNGISLVIFTGICGQLVSRVSVHVERFSFYGLLSYFIGIVALGGLFFFAYVLLNTRVAAPFYHEKSNKAADYFDLNLCPSSTEALTFTSTLVMIPVTIVYSYGLGTEFLDQFQPASFWYNAISILFIIIISYLLGWAFLHPRKRLGKLNSWGWHAKDDDNGTADTLLRRQFIYNLPWTLFLCLIAVVPTILISGANVPFYIGGSTIPLTVAICLDLMAWFKFTQQNIQGSIKIAEYHDVYDANMIKNHLEAIGIECHLQGYHHRLLLYFFGPFIDISLIVSDQNKNEAQKVIQDYYGGVGLSTRYRADTT